MYVNKKSFNVKVFVLVLDRKVTIRQCISQKAIVNFDPENPPLPTQPVKSIFRGYNADSYFCEKDYCNGASTKNLSVIAFIFTTIIVQFICK